MHELLDADLWHGMLVEEVIEWQPTMFQPIGGMDRIPIAFANGSIRDPLRRRRDAAFASRTPASRSRTATSSGADREYHRSRPTTASAPCRSPSRARSTPTSAPQIRAILDKVQYDSAYKIAWEAPRFWEKEANIYGGISYLQQTVDLVWYPSARLFSEKRRRHRRLLHRGTTQLGALPDLLASRPLATGPQP